MNVVPIFKAKKANQSKWALVYAMKKDLSFRDDFVNTWGWDKYELFMASLIVKTSLKDLGSR